MIQGRFHFKASTIRASYSLHFLSLTHTHIVLFYQLSLTRVRLAMKYIAIDIYLYLSVIHTRTTCQRFEEDIEW